MKYTKIFPALAVALILALLLTPVLSTPALAFGEEIELDPEEGKIGAEIRIIGEDFRESDIGRWGFGIYFSEDEAEVNDEMDYDVNTYELVKTGEIESDGTFDTEFDVPLELTDGDDDEDVTSGTYYICVVYYDSISHEFELLIVAVAEFTVTAGDIRLYPTRGAVGTDVEITGEGFGDREYITVEFDDDEVDIESGDYRTDSDGDFDLTIIIPESTAGDHEIKVIGEDSASEATAEFTVEPDITLSPTLGPPGTEVTVTGTGFGYRSYIEYVEFARKDITNDIDVDYDTNRDGSFEFTFLVPSKDLGTYDLEVEDEDGNSAEAEFTIFAAAIVSLSLPTGYVGTEVTVSGTAFKASNTVTITFNNKQVATTTTDNIGSFSANFNTPPAPGGTHEVKISDGTSTATANFVINFSTTLSEMEGYVGSEVTVSGTGFKASSPISITFDNKQITTTMTDNVGSFNTSFTVPVRVTGTYRVRISDGTNTASLNFNIGTSTSISQTSGHVGSELTINGIGFVAGRTVTVTYDKTKVATATVSTDGTFSTTFKVPASASGENAIVVTDGITTQQFSFTMESDPPSPPRPLSPEMGVKAKAQAYLDWDIVTDPSGVTYSLQIATDADFSEDSIVLGKTGLTRSDYTITKEERLKSVSKDSPYYWHVMAVDGASNESPWSGTGMFYVGFQFALPQPVIYALCGVGALLCGIIGFWMGRRTVDFY